MSESLVGSSAPDWATTTLGALCAAGGGDIQTGPFGSQLHASDYVPTGVPSVMPQNIGDNVIREEGIARITPADAARLSRYLLQADDIVYSRRGDVTRRALVQHFQEGWLCGTGCLRVRLGTSANARFISYYLGHPNVHEWIERHAIGATMLNLNTKILSALPVTCPPSAEQDAIAEILGALDDKIAANDRISTVTLKLTDQIFKAAAAAIKAGPDTFASAADVYGGGTPRTSQEEYWGGAIPWATPSDVTGLAAPYLFGTSRTITESGLESCASHIYPAGSIFMTSRATIGAFAVPQVPTAVNQGFIVVVPRRPEMRWWLFHEMRSKMDEMLSLANGSTFLELSRKNFKAMSVRIASEAVIKRFNAEVDPLHARSTESASESMTLVRLRDSLLPKLMSGAIRVKDAEKVVEDAV